MAFEPENGLEIELVRAAHDSDLQAAFLRELLDSQVYLALLVASGPGIASDPNGRAVILPETELTVGAADRAGGPALPVFSSPRRAQEFYAQDHVVAADTARVIFARHPETRFVLNPGSDYAVDLSEADIAGLLGGNLTAH